MIDIKVTNPGNNYTFPPFVEIVDNCKQGLGGVARATVKDGNCLLYTSPSPRDVP